MLGLCMILCAGDTSVRPKGEDAQLAQSRLKLHPRRRGGLRGEEQLQGSSRGSAHSTWREITCRGRNASSRKRRCERRLGERDEQQKVAVASKPWEPFLLPVFGSRLKGWRQVRQWVLGTNPPSADLWGVQTCSCCGPERRLVSRLLPCPLPDVDQTNEQQTMLEGGGCSCCPATGGFCSGCFSLNQWWGWAKLNRGSNMSSILYVERGWCPDLSSTISEASFIQLNRSVTAGPRDLEITRKGN